MSAYPLRHRAIRPSPLFLAVVAITVLGGMLAWQGGSSSRGSARTGVFLLVVGGWVLTLCFHEFAHAYVAHRAGDTSIEAQGYLTLNPFKYAHPVLSILLPIVFILQGGFGLPGGAVYLHPHAFHSRWQRTLASAAGPLVNIVCAVVLLEFSHGSTELILFFGTNTPPLPQSHVTFHAAIAFLGFLQLSAAVLNLLPIPGTDGYGIIETYLAPQTAYMLAPVKPWGMIAIFVLLSGSSQLNRWFFQFIDSLYRHSGADPYLYNIGASLVRIGHSVV